MMPRSLRARLLIGAVLWIGLGVATAGVFISALFRMHVTELVDDELVGHIDELERLLVRTPDGGITLSRRLSDPRFAQPGAGYYWQVHRDGKRILRSPSLDGRQVLPPPSAAARVALVRLVEPGPAGPAIVYERAWRSDPGHHFVIRVFADQRIVDEVLARFNRALAASLGLLALALVAAGALQIRFGLTPLRTLKTALTALRNGDPGALKGRFPSEVQPLVDDLDDVLTANIAMVRRARTQAGNLAHGLKTPLAILSDEARRLRSRGEIQSAQVLTEQCDRMARHIDHQLARARAAANAGLPGVRTVLEPAITNIVSAMQRLYAHRALTYEVAVPPRLAVAVDSRDLDEIIANLLDNASKWARSSVRIEARHRIIGNAVEIAISDDGDGIAPEALGRVFAPGERLDETMPGSGLGLAIVQDLTVLHDGTIALERAQSGGLLAILQLRASPIS